jgi:hypothetical protein
MKSGFIPRAEILDRFIIPAVEWAAPVIRAAGIRVAYILAAESAWPPEIREVVFRGGVVVRADRP